MKAIKIAAAALPFVLALTACQKQEAPQNEHVKTESVSDTPALLVCDTSAIKNALTKAVAEQTHNYVNHTVGNFANAEELQLHRRTLQRLAEVGFLIEDIQVQGDTCTARLVVDIPVVDSTYAEQYYHANHLASLNDRLAQAQFSLQNGKIIAPITYTIDTAGNPVIGGDMSGLSVVADMMSASAYNMAQSENRIDTMARAPVVVRPLQTQPAPAPRPLPEPITEPAPSAQNTETTQTTSPAQTTSPQASEPTPKVAETHAPVVGDGEMVIVETDETY